MRRALLFAGDLCDRGGGSQVSAWVAQALLREYAVTLVTWRCPDLDEVDACYGTELAGASGLSVVTSPLWLRGLFKAQPMRLALLRGMLLQRQAARLVATLDPDLLVSCANEADLGRPLVQYLHYPWAMYPRPEVERRWFHCSRAVQLYRGFVLRLGGFDPARQSANLTLANSSWTAGLYLSCYGLPARPLPPPAPIEEVGLDWPERDEAFIVIGRISREKRLVEAVRLVERLRANGHAVTLRICGFADDSGYLAELRKVLASAGDWVTLELDLPRERLLRRIGQCRYGLHMMIDEHFGIAVAEMMRLGCIPFAHASAGPLETLEGLPLTFSDDDEAFALIARRLAQPAQQESLRRRLAERAERYTPERFMTDLLACCEAWARSGQPELVGAQA